MSHFKKSLTAEFHPHRGPVTIGLGRDMNSEPEHPRRPHEVSAFDGDCDFGAVVALDPELGCACAEFVVATLQDSFHPGGF